MFEYLFPIFAFGLLTKAIVCKGLLAAADVAKAQRAAEEDSISSAVSPAAQTVFVPPVVTATQSTHA